MSQEQINKVPGTGNVGFARTKGTYIPGKILGALFHRTGTDLLAHADLDSPFAALFAKTTHNTFIERAFFVNPFEPDSEFNGEGRATETRGQNKYTTAKGTWDYIFTIVGKYADYLQAKRWAKNKQGIYSFVPVDENFVMRHKRSATGIYGFETLEIDVLPPVEASTSAIIRFQIRIALVDRNQIDDAEHTHIIDDEGVAVDVFDRVSGLLGVEYVTIRETTFGSPGNGIHYISVEGSEGEENFVEMFQAADKLRQPGAWNLTLANGTSVAITSVALIIVDNVVLYLALTLDQDDYTNGVTGYLRSSSVSTIYGYTNRYFETNTIKLALVKA